MPAPPPKTTFWVFPWFFWMVGMAGVSLLAWVGRAICVNPPGAWFTRFNGALLVAGVGFAQALVFAKVCRFGPRSLWIVGVPFLRWRRFDKTDVRCVRVGRSSFGWLAIASRGASEATVNLGSSPSIPRRFARWQNSPSSSPPTPPSPPLEKV